MFSDSRQMNNWSTRAKLFMLRDLEIAVLPISGLMCDDFIKSWHNLDIVFNC